MDLSSEIRYSFSRSGGAGGQNVNKVNTRVELRINIRQSNILKDYQKQRIELSLSSRINKHGDLILTSEETRNQLKNKKAVTRRLYLLLENALKVSPRRIPTKPTKASKEKRIKAKKMQAERKNTRRRLNY